MDKGTIQSFIERVPHAGVVGGSGDWHLTCRCIMAPITHLKRFDRSPSMTVSYGIGSESWVECFSCGYKAPLEKTLYALAAQGIVDTGVAMDYTEAKTNKLVLFSEVKPTGDECYDIPLAHLEKNEYSPLMLQFLEQKGIPVETAKRFQLCYVPKGHSDEWMPLDDNEEPRVVKHPGIAVPMFIKGPDQKMTCIGAQLRYLEGKFRYFTLYKFSSSSRLYGEHILPLAEGRPLFVVEGPFDALHILSCGFLAVALFGTTVNDAKVELLKSAGASCVHLLLDPDAPGQKASRKAEPILQKYGVPYTSHIATKDPKRYTKSDLINLLS